MINSEQLAYSFGAIFGLSNRLQVLGDKFDKNISVKQWFLIAGIFKFNEEYPTISEVSSIIGSSRQNVKKMALILEKQGFLSLINDEKDGRIIRLCLSEKCRDYFKERENREDEFLLKVFKDFDVDLLEGLFKGLTQLERNLILMENEYEKEK